MSKKLFGVKVILLHSIKDKENITKHSYEEIILTIKAEDHDSAQEKANEYAEGYCKDYENPYGETVLTEIVSIDSFESFDEDDGVTEVYSNNYFTDGTECTLEDNYALRNLEFNPPSQR